MKTKNQPEGQPQVATSDLVRLAGFYGIEPYIKFEDVWPFGDSHDVGKIKPDLEDQIIAAELKRRGIDSAASYKAIHELLDAYIAKANQEISDG